MGPEEPGFHKLFDVTQFNPKEQRILRRLSDLFQITRHGKVRLTTSSEYRYALIKPIKTLKTLLHTEREVMLLFSEYNDFQPRTLDAFDRILEDTPEEFRVEKVVRVLVSADPKCDEKIRKLFKSSPETPVIIPFSSNDISLSTQDSEIFARIRSFTFSRDLFSMSSPLRSDLFFYGRNSLIHEISAKLESGENFGLFGLRRSGKTSIVFGVERTLMARNCAAVVFQCQNPSIHQRRWHDLLHYIVQQVKSSNSIVANTLPEKAYSEIDASDSFLKDMTLLRKRSGRSKLVLLFDEVENISFQSGSSDHWREGRDSLLLWQAVRSGFQSTYSPYSFLLVGTNPSVVERTELFGSDNPLFGNVEQRYISMFDYPTLASMIDELGELMGTTFDDGSKHRIFSEFGGHPFLTRHACSAVTGTVNKRPIVIDLSITEDGLRKFRDESSGYVQAVVSVLKEHYNDEFELLRLLAAGDTENFEYYASADPKLIQHLIGYHLISSGHRGYYFRIDVIRDYFRGLSRPGPLMTLEEKWEEVSRRRNLFEQRFRSLISDVLKVHFSQSKRADAVLSKLPESRRDKLIHLPFQELLSPGDSPLMLLELQSLVSGHWDKFVNRFEVEKGEFEYHLKTVNGLRKDAHAKEMSEDELSAFRVSMARLEKLFEH